MKKLEITIPVLNEEETIKLKRLPKKYIPELFD